MFRVNVLATIPYGLLAREEYEIVSRSSLNRFPGNGNGLAFNTTIWLKFKICQRKRMYIFPLFKKKKNDNNNHKKPQMAGQWFMRHVLIFGQKG